MVMRRAFPFAPWWVVPPAPASLRVLLRDRFVTKRIFIAVLLASCFVGGTNAGDTLQWRWSIAGDGVTASGTFVTDDIPDADGFYRITAITGTVNSATITGLQPAGTAIPGNSGFSVDNLVRATDVRLTTHGFGFAASDGTYHNPFFVLQYRDYISRPPYPDGEGSEPTVEFSASINH
jgi:hypothetical protein